MNKKLGKSMLKDRYAVLDKEGFSYGTTDTIHEVHKTKEDAYREIGHNSIDENGRPLNKKGEIEAGKTLVNDGYYSIITLKGKIFKKR